MIGLDKTSYLNSDIFRKLGRRNVCALIKSKVEIPSDYQGIVYIDYDEKNAWKFQIAKELKSAGFEIDMNNLI